MLERTLPDEAVTAPPAPLAPRRVLFFALVGLTIAALGWLLVVALSAGGFGVLDLVLVVLFTVTLPWFVIGFWNAAIGFLVMRFARDPVATVTPAAARVAEDAPITASTAILACIRNEPPERVVRHLVPMMDGLAARGVGDHFHLYVLSDSDEPTVVAAEAAGFAALASTWRGRVAISYRRREQNSGFKAGNISDFCERWGDNHDYALVLDADSVMTADAVLRLVRVMQSDPQLGILQSLVVGMPSSSAFARIFQFGMRLGMRSYTIGSAWWQGDCGPYWGHNALVRLQPFRAHCALPLLSDGEHVLSHDQIEAVLMRRAGYEVRVLPEEGASFEENPPTLPEFIRRDLRWAQGNMQYWPYLVMRGLRPVSRYQIAFAMLMFLGSPAWIGLLVIGTLALAAAGTPEAFIRADAGATLFFIIVVMWFAPKIATVFDVLSRPALRRAFGGPVRFITSVVTETVFFLMLSPIMWVGHTMFLTGLVLGKKIGWGGQARDDHAVSWADAARVLWPHTLIGCGCIAVLAFTVPSAIPYALFIAGGPALSIPLAVVTSRPSVGQALMRVGIGALPEENAPPAPLRALALPAIEAAALRAA